jgi:hypothetical protein
MTTIDEVYVAISPLPARLAEKGKARPEVTLMVSANAGITIYMRWRKPYSRNDWDTDSECCTGDTFEEAYAKAAAFISALPSAEDAKLHHFMGKLGHLIDAARDDGIAVDYVNPLVDTMKRLSENVITHQPATA